ncbi:MAG: hypothetical protein R3D86_01110 [Emcibacteraceae bacterium]
MTKFISQFASRIFYSLLVCGFLYASAQAQSVDLTTEKTQAPFGNLDKTPQLGNVVYSRQPDEATIPMLKDQGIKMVLSVRYEDEPVGFDARKLIEKNGIAFQQISFYKGSINDQPRAIDPQAIEEISKLLDATSASGSKVLLHCESGQRAAGALAAVLYKDHGYSKEQSIDYAKKAGMTSQNVLKALEDYMSDLKR